MTSSTTLYKQAVAKQTASPDAADAPPATGYTGLIGVQPVVAQAAAAGSTIETVGPGKQFATIAQAVAAAQDGWTILVSAGTYTNDFATVTHDVTMIGVGGVVKMVATKPPPNLKGILTVDASATIENFAFSGAAIDDADGGNGAGIRYEGGDMVLRNDSFTHNQDGLLAFPVLGLPSNTITLDHDTFDANGSGSGYTHNAYIGAVDKLTVTNSVFEQAVVGHELKSRALVNDITNNSFYDGPTGTASYDIDLPNGGKDVVSNNTIEKGPDAENNAMVHFGGEGIPYSGSSLLVEGDAFVDDKGSAIGVLNQTAISATIEGDTFAHMTGSAVASGPATETDNFDGAGDRFADGALVGVLPGSTKIYTDAAPHTLLLDGSNPFQAVEGGGGLLNVTASIGHIVAIGGAGGMDYTELPPSGGNSVTTAAGAKDRIVLAGQDTLDSEGDDAITAGPGNITAVVNGTSTIDDGAGSNQWSIGGSTAITSNNSNEFVTVGEGASVSIHGTNQYLQIGSNDGSAAFDITIAGERFAAALDGGSYAMRTYGAAMNITTGGGAEGVSMSLLAGDANVTSVGADVIQAGSGSDDVIVSGGAQVYAGTGKLSVFGRGDTAGAKVYGDGGDVTLDGDTGNITYYGGARASSVESKLSNDTFVGGAGRMTINGGSRETIEGGSGGVVFNSQGGGADQVTTAMGAVDTLKLSGSDVIDSYGTDTINTTGSLTGSVHGRTWVTAGTADVSLSYYGVNEAFTGLGHDTLTVAKGASVTASMSGYSDVTETGGAVRYIDEGVSGHATAYVSGGAADIHSQAGQGITVTTTAGVSTQVQLGTGPGTVYAASNDQVHAGSGADSVIVTGKGASVWGGSAATSVLFQDYVAGAGITVYGGSGALTYDQGPGALSFIGGSGSATINGEYGSLSIVGGSGSLSVKGGQAGFRFTGGSGTASIALTPGGGAVQFGGGATTVTEAGYGAADIYTFVAGHKAASDLITGFQTGTDQLVLKGVSVVSQNISNGSDAVVFSDGSRLTLQGVTSLQRFTVASPPAVHKQPEP